MMNLEEPITKEEILETQQYLLPHITPTPLLPLNLDLPNRKVYLKCENLSPIGSFKLKGALNCLRQLSKDELANGVYTVSAGNFAQGLLWACNKYDIPCTILVPDSAPDTKVAAIQRLGGKVIKLPFDDWWNVIQTQEYSPLNERLIHPVFHRSIIQGTSVIGKEIYDQLPQVDTVLMSYGGGTMATGIGSTFKTFKPSVKTIACEAETATPLTAALAAGKPVKTDNRASFIDGSGCGMVLEPMFELVKKVIHSTVVVKLDSVAEAIRIMVDRNRIIAEGAGALPVAAAIEGLAGDGNIVCVVSGGNIDTRKLVTILNGGTP